MKKIKTFAEWVIALTRGYIKATGKKPDKLAKLKINMEAGQKVKDQNKVIEFPRDKITDWTKARPQPPEVKIIDGIQTTRGMGDLFERQLKKTVKKTEAQIKSQIEKQNKESIANINRQMIEEDRAIKDMYRTAGPRTLDEDAGYLAEFLADDAGKFLDDLPIAEQTKFYNRAKNALIRHQKKKPDPEDFAGGGVAGMLGEPTYQDDNHRVPLKGGKKVLEGLAKIMDDFFPGTTKVGQTSKPMAEKTQLKRALADFQEREKKSRQLTDDEYDDFVDELGGEDHLEAYTFDGTVGDAQRILKEQKDYHDYMYQQYKMGKLEPKAGEVNRGRLNLLRERADEAGSSGDPKLFSRDDYDELEYLEDHFKQVDKEESFQFAERVRKAKEKARVNKKSPWFKDPKTLTPEEELRKEFPGIDDNLIKNILADKNPQRIAEVKATLHEALKMQQKGMGHEEIIKIFKKKPTKHASGGLAGMLGE